MNHLIRVTLLALVMLLSSNSAWGQLGTEFTFQGQLADGGQPATGNYDLDISLWDADVAGSQVGATNSFAGHPVNDGLFTVQLDFGASSLNGDDRWLEISVNGTALVPRQPVNGTPYSIQTRGLSVNDDETFVGVGRWDDVTVGIGSTGAGYRLNVMNDGYVGVGRDTPVANTEAFGIYRSTSGFAGMFIETNAGGSPYYGYVRDGSIDAHHYLEGATGTWHVWNGGDERLSVTDTGAVGIGTTDPEAPLHIQKGSAGNVVANSASTAVFESSTTNYISILSPNGSNRGILFGDPGNVADGGILYHTNPVPDGFEFRTGGNITRMVIDADGYVGFGRTSPISATSYFDVDTPAGSGQFGGMHINTAATQGSPFYAYSTGGVTQAHTYYNGATDKWHLWIGGNTPIVVQQNGFVGLSTFNPQFTLHVNGTAGKPGGGSWDNTSDARLKKNIADLDGSLDKLMKLRGVSFEYIDPKSINELEGERIGVIAQEVEKIFPDWVNERNDGYKSVTFRGFEALTVEALREMRAEKDQQIADQDAKIASLRADHEAEISELQQQMIELKQIVAQLAASEKEN